MQYGLDIFECRKGEIESVLRHRDNIEAQDDEAAIAKATALYSELSSNFAKASATFALGRFVLYDGERLVHEYAETR